MTMHTTHNQRPLRLGPATVVGLLTLLFWTPLGLAAQESAPAAENDWTQRLDEELPLDPLLTVGRLDNGLTYYVRHNPTPEDRVELWLVVDAGSVLEDPDQRGLAHFVEHMAFNGTEKYERLELVDYLETIGMRFGPDINATTSFDETTYMLRVPSDSPELVDTGLDILHQWASAVTFDEEEVERERGVVTEEWRLGRGFSARLRDQQFPLLFKGSAYAERLPIGTPEILQNAPAQRLKDFYRDWYRPNLMAVIAVGDIDREEIAAKIVERFSNLENPVDERERIIHPIPDHEETLYGVATDPEALSTTFAIFNKLPRRPEGRVGDYRAWIVERVYHMLVNSRLEEYTRTPNPPFLVANSSAGRFVRSKHVSTLVAAVGEGQVERGMRALLTEVERLARFGFTQSELDRVKAQYLRTYERAAEERDLSDSGSYASEYTRVFLVDEPTPGIAIELELVQQFVPDITLEEMNQLAAQTLDSSNRVVLVSAPEKFESLMPAEAEALALFEEVTEAELEPFVDDVPDQPLLAALPTPGTVVTEEYVEELDVTVWQLSNGIRVILRPTDFRSDQVLMTAFSPGGNSVVDDDTYPSALLATTVVEESGLGDFDPLQLEKMLAGKSVQISTYIEELEEGLDAGASSRDLEELFKLVNLAFTRPRIDDQAYQAVMGRVRGWIYNRGSHPVVQFEDRVNAVVTGNHPRRKPMDNQLLAQVDLDEVRSVYADRFGDAGDFTFVIVGSFDLEQLRSLATTYLASLPGGDREETWRNIGVEGPEEKQTIEVFSGLEPKSQVRLIFSGEAEFAPQRLYDLRSTAQALRIRLREVLREEMGATYGVSVNSNLTDRPEPGYRLSIEFGCAPENVDEMVDRVFGVLSEMSENGLPESYITKVREQQRRRRETQWRENGFWLRALSEYYRHDWDPLLLLQHDDLLDGLGSDTVRDAVRKYFDPDQYVLGVLYPEGFEKPQPEERAAL